MNILFNTNYNLNLTSGCTIMASNYINDMMKLGFNVTIVSKFNVSHIFKRNLEMKNYNIMIKNDKQLVLYLDKNDYKYEILFFRNHNIIIKLNNKKYLSKVIFYGLDIHLNELKKINNFKKIITQSEKLKEKYIKNGIPRKKIKILEPYAYKYNFTVPLKKNNSITLIYCGTLRDEENIIEIINNFKIIHNKNPKILLKIIYGKIFNSNKNFKEKINKILKNGVKGVIFKNNLSHRDACYEIATSDFGICWRKNGWGDNGEISTKVKEYKMYGLKIIYNLNKIKIINKIYYDSFRIQK